MGMFSDKKVLKSLFGLIFALALSITSISTYAWFASSKDVNANGMGVSVATTSGASVEEFQVFQRDGLADGAKIVATNDNNNGIVMSEYDTVFTDRNVNTPIIIRAVVKNTTEPTQINYSVACSSSWTDSNTVSGTLTKQLSNIIGVRCAYISSISALNPNTNPDEIYSGAISYFSNQNNNTFAKVDDSGNNLSKATTISGSIDSFSYDNGKVVLFIEIDYSSALVNAYINQNGINVGVDSSSANNLIDFTYDLKEFVFDCK